MAIDINLLPETMKASLLREHRMRLALLGLIFSGVIIFLLYCSVTVMALQIWSETAQLRQEQVPVINKINPLLQYASLQTDIAQKEALIKKATGNATDWPALLGSLGENIPDGLWLSGLTFTSEQIQVTSEMASETDNTAEALDADLILGQLTIAGYTNEYSTIDNWLIQIRRVPGLKDVRYSFATQEEHKEIQIIHFEVYASVVNI